MGVLFSDGTELDVYLHLDRSGLQGMRGHICKKVSKNVNLLRSQLGGEISIATFMLPEHTNFYHNMVVTRGSQLPLGAPGLHL